MVGHGGRASGLSLIHPCPRPVCKGCIDGIVGRAVSFTAIGRGFHSTALGDAVYGSGTAAAWRSVAQMAMPGLQHAAEQEQADGGAQLAGAGCMARAGGAGCVCV